MIAINFEKAFDTLDFQFLIRTLHKFNFGPSFIHWIRVLYKNASSCVMNNGFTTGPFLLGIVEVSDRGDPPSPYLFILALGTLAIKTREDCNVQGLKIGEEMIKLSLFADLLRCQRDNQHVFNRCTRSSITDIILPKFHLDVAKKSFYYHGACIFNSLPTNIKILPPKERFKAISDFYSKVIS